MRLEFAMGRLHKEPGGRSLIMLHCDKCVLKSVRELVTLAVRVMIHSRLLKLLMKMLCGLGRGRFTARGIQMCLLCIISFRGMFVNVYLACLPSDFPQMFPLTQKIALDMFNIRQFSIVPQLLFLMTSCLFF